MAHRRKLRQHARLDEPLLPSGQLRCHPASQAHFQRGSVAVKAGDRVQRGQLVGKCGNSGNSSEPHLHYQLQHSAIFQDALGIKCVFDKVPLVRDGTVKSNYSPVKGDVINAE